MVGDALGEPHSRSSLRGASSPHANIIRSNQWLIQLDNSTSIVRQLQYSSLLLMLRCGVNRCLKCILPIEAEIVKPRYALFHQLPRAIILDLF